MSFYGDLLRNHENRFKKNFYAGIPFYLKIKTQPSESVDLQQSFKVNRTVENAGETETVAYNIANAATLKTSCCEKACSSKLKFNNANVIYEVAYKPKGQNTPDQTLQLKHVSKLDNVSSKLESTETVKYGSPKVGPVRLWLTLDLVWNNQDAKKNLKGTTSINYEEFNLGVKFDHDLAKQAIKSLNAQLVRKNAKGDFFLSGDILKKTLTIGCHHPHGDRANHAYEVLVDTQKQLKGLCGQPLALNWAGEYKLSDDATVKSKLLLGAEAQFTYAWIHRLDKNVKIGFTHDLNVSKVLNNGASPYNFGALLQWSI